MASKFKTGDVVTLIGTKPPVRMVVSGVEAVDGVEAATAFWFDKNNDLRMGKTPTAVLVKL